MNNFILHKSETRGHSNHSWLSSYHTFSFANYHNPERMNFGALRVLNDDTVKEGMGFGTHPHNNMEIVSIPLEGDLEHKDSMGNISVIRSGDIQLMSAGKGITHSEYNKNNDQLVKFLQIWVIPNKRNVTPRYDQITLNKQDRKNSLQQIVSPHADDKGVRIYQDAWFHLGYLDKDFKTDYALKKQGNGIYFFLISGKINIAGQDLKERDGFGIWDITSISIHTKSTAELLIMEVPLTQ
jgi:redox-sensitive bicupin YhaK (pirin superfamily)